MTRVLGTITVHLFGWVIAVLAACAHPPTSPRRSPPHAVVIVSATTEWNVVKLLFADARVEPTPWGEAFHRVVEVDGQPRDVVIFHGGWGKVAAAGSAQYAIDRWRPRYVINFGTAGGFAGAVDRHAVLVVDRTVIYDIKEAMGDSAEAIRDYTTELDLSWLAPPYPSDARRTVMVSGDRDLIPDELGELAAKYGAIAGDWETGAIAYTCARNHQRVLIVRGVTDLVSVTGGEAYGNIAAFASGADVVMRKLFGDLPRWLAKLP